MPDNPTKENIADVSNIARKIHSLETLLDFAKVLNSARTLKAVYDAIMLTCMGEKGISVTSIMLLENQKGHIFEIKAVKGVDLSKDKKVLKFTEELNKKISRKGYALFEDLKTTESKATLEILNDLTCKIIIPVHFHNELIALFLCGPKIMGITDQYSDDDIDFLKLIASYSGIAISNLIGIGLLNKKKEDLEKKLFELEALEETRRALTSTLNIDMLCHALLLSVMGYLKSESGFFYISMQDQEEFSLIANTIKKNDSPLPQRIFLDKKSFQIIANNNFIRRETESLLGLSGLLDSVNSTICFPIQHEDTFRALCFLGPKAIGPSFFYKQSELDQAVMLVRQSISPIRNSILHLELQVNNKILQEAEEKARNNETRLINILETSNEGFVELDFSGTILNINQELCRIIGLPKEEILHRNIGCFIPQESLSIVLEQLEKRKKGEKSKYEASIISNTGEWVHCLISAAPIYENPDMSGEPSASFAMITDITKLKETEEKLREFAKIVSASNDIIALIDNSQFHKTINKAYEKAFGLSEKQIDKTSLEDVFGKDQYQGIIEPSITKCLNGENVHFRSWINLPEFGSRYLDTAFYPYFENNDVPSAAIIIMRDVTEIKMLETNLQQAQKMEAIGALAGGIAHDFNNILSGILGYISLAQLFSEPRTKEYLQKAENSCQRAADLIKQILTFARKNEEEMKPFELSPIVMETLRLIRASVPATISIKKDIESSSKMIIGNPTQIHQIILNLCTNAVHAMEDKGGSLEISLHSFTRDDLPPLLRLKNCPYFVLTVQDDGEGMTNEVMERIFEPFFTTKKQGKGTGLGLSMSHGIVKSHGGEITVESKPGKGTKFSVYLPITEAAQEHKKDVFSESAPTGKERILFVDDEETIAEISILLLENLGYHISGFTDPLKALETFVQKPDDFDIIITDQTMPGMTGLELGSKIKKIRADIPIIICSGFSEQLTPEKLKAAGINSYIVKPLTQKRLSETIRSLLDINKRGHK